LLYYNYRYIIPEIGRWLKRDMINEIDNNNVYLSVKNNSINNYDNLGLYSLFCINECEKEDVKIIDASFQILSRSFGDDPEYFNSIGKLVDDLYLLKDIFDVISALIEGNNEKAILEILKALFPSAEPNLLKIYIHLLNKSSAKFSGVRLFTKVTYQTCEQEKCCIGGKYRYHWGRKKISDPRFCEKDTEYLYNDSLPVTTFYRALENIGPCIEEHIKEISHD